MGKKKPGSRTTISVPADLRRRMDSVKEPVNWSALACRAFETKLAEIAAKKERKTMDDVIQRLRGSKQQSDDELYREGQVEGIDWAKNHSEAIQLERWERLQAGLGTDFNAWFQADDNQSAYSTAERLAFSAGEEDGDRRAASDFWEQAIGDEWETKVSDPSFLAGFFDGAMEVWAEVKDKI